MVDRGGHDGVGGPGLLQLLKEANGGWEGGNFAVMRIRILWRAFGQGGRMDFPLDLQVQHGSGAV